MLPVMAMLSLDSEKRGLGMEPPQVFKLCSVSEDSQIISQADT